MSAYLTIRGWIDSLWKQPGLQIKLTLLPVFVLGGVGAVADSTVLWIVLSMAAVGWVGFVFWRGWRRIKVEAIRQDRHFDRFGKTKLGHEYHRTESATAARARKKKQNG